MGGMQMDSGATSGGQQMNQSSMPGMNHGASSSPAPATAGGAHAGHGGAAASAANSAHAQHVAMPAANAGASAHAGHGAAAPSNSYPPPTYLEGQVGVDNVAMSTMSRVDDPGAGFPPGRRVLRYTDLQALTPARDSRPPSRDIVLHLTGNMERFMWGFDGKKYSEAPEPILLRYGEHVRFVLINDTMMEHPMHLHGMFSELENGHGEYRPLKHTVLVKPAEQLSFLVTADAYGRWAFHCHLLFHMESGMFREVRVI